MSTLIIVSVSVFMRLSVMEMIMRTNALLMRHIQSRSGRSGVVGVVELSSALTP